MASGNTHEHFLGRYGHFFWVTLVENHSKLEILRFATLPQTLCAGKTPSMSTQFWIGSQRCHLMSNTVYVRVSLTSWIHLRHRWVFTSHFWLAADTFLGVVWLKSTQNRIPLSFAPPSILGQNTVYELSPAYKILIWSIMTLCDVKSC